MTDKDLGLSQLPLRRIELEILQERRATVGRRAVPLALEAPGAARELLVAVEEARELGTVGETGATHAHVLEQTEVLDLVSNARHVPVVVLLGLVGLDAANVVRLARGERLHQRLRRVLDLEAGGRRALLVVLGVVGEERAQEGVLGHLQGLDQVVEQRILVLVAEALDVVRHLQE